MLVVQDLAKAFGGHTLFVDVNLRFDPGKVYGIVGANGAGKSTLLRILAGEEPASEGEVTVPRKVRLGVLDQDHFKYEDTRILDVVMMGDTELWDAITQRDALLDGPEADFDVDRFSALEENIAHLDGYTIEARAAEVLAGLNIPVDRHDEPLSVLSGGYKLRVLLAQVLASRPDLLILDEPTNHLDIVSLDWLEAFLRGFSGCVIVVSHDHQFLDNVCTDIVDVDYQQVRQYKGNYTAFEVGKAEERARKESDISKREAEIAEHKAFIARFKAKATKARQANSRVKRLAKIVIDELPQSSRRYPTFRFPQQRPSGRDVLKVDGVGKAYGDNVVLVDVNLEVRRGEHIAVIGPNGIGKSTLLKILHGDVEPDEGEVAWGHETHVQTFAQDNAHLFESRETLHDWFWDRFPGESIGFVRGKLAEVLFTKDDVDKKVTALSGGERARVVFALIGAKQPNVMLLDEPTNHLDLEGIEALTQGLEAYEGTLIFVSHNRWFVQRLATRVVELSEDGVFDFHGTYDEYVRHKREDHLDAAAVLAAEADKRSRQRKQKRVAR